MPTSTKAPPDPRLLSNVRSDSEMAAAAIMGRDLSIVDAINGGHTVAAVARAADLDWKTVTRIRARVPSEE